jgi:hypothetical protein
MAKLGGAGGDIFFLSLQTRHPWRSGFHPEIQSLKKNMSPPAPPSLAMKSLSIVQLNVIEKAKKRKLAVAFSICLQLNHHEG